MANVDDEDIPRLPDKAIALGRGRLGWVDLCRGMLVCNVLDIEKDPVPVLRFIPLPRPKLTESREGCPRPSRYVVTCSDGFIKFIEMEHIQRQVFNGRMMNVRVLDCTDVIYDSDLVLYNNVDAKPYFVPDGWRNASCDCWHKGVHCSC